MKKYLLFAAAAVLVSLLPACEKNKDTDLVYRTAGVVSEIHISGITGNHPEITDVELVARFHVPAGAATGGSTIGPNGEDTRIMLRVPFNPKDTRLVLPENPPQQLLNNIAGDIPKGFRISDPDAKTISFVEIACNMGNTDRVTETLCLHRSVGDAEHDVTFIYCDRTVTITGSGEDWWGHPLTYDLSLQKGWNVVIEKSVNRVGTISNQLPNGLKWSCVRWLGGR